MKQFYDNNHANNRLSRCFVLLGPPPYTAKRIENATKNKIICDDGTEYDLKSPDVHITMDELGYYNTRHQCVYITRSTRRMWKAGLVPENLILEHVYPQYVTHRDADIRAGQYLPFIMNNQYPTFEEALNTVKIGQAACVAFSRKFAVGLAEMTLNPVIYYKNNAIAFLDDDGTIIMGDVNSHLLEQLVHTSGREVLI